MHLQCTLSLPPTSLIIPPTLVPPLLTVSEKHVGAAAQLVGAVEIPLTPDVIIDVWRGPDQLCWATTSVNGVSFAGTYTLLQPEQHHLSSVM